MAAVNSCLSKYGYDFVASTCQRSIGALMLESMDEAGVEGPPLYFFGVNDVCDKTSALARTGGIDPLNTGHCPDDMPTTHQNFEALHKAGFSFGCKYTIGLPASTSASQRPPCVTFCKDGNGVLLNMLFKEITIVQARNDAGGKLWNRSRQLAQGPPWYATTKLSIVQETVDDLENDAYFKRHGAAAKEIERKIKKDEIKAPSLKRIVLSWKNYDMTHIQTTGTPDQTSGQVKSVMRHVAGKLAEVGLAPLYVVVVAGTSGTVPHITAFDWRISTCQNNPDISTLDVLCTTGGRPMPQRPHRAFDWHWMEQEDLPKKHGMTCASSMLIADFLRAQFWTKMKNTFCSKFTCHVDTKSSIFVTSEPDPDRAWVQLNPQPGVLLRVEYWNIAKLSKDSVTLMVDYNYTLEIKCFQQNLSASQIVHANLTVGYDSVFAKPCAITAQNYDEYGLAVDAEGQLSMEWLPRGWVKSPALNFVPDNRWDPDFKAATLGCVKVFFADFKKKIGEKLLASMPLSKLNKFVFPGGQVYSFKNPMASVSADILCDVTFTSPAAAAASSPPDDVGRQPHPDLPLVLSHTSELMINYIPGGIVDFVGPSGKFMALQTSNGHSLIFAIDGSQDLNVVEEQSGPGQGKSMARLGWDKTRLSPADAKVTHFGANQNATSGTISIAVVTEYGGKEALLVSLDNSNENLSWITKPSWKPVQFDAESTVPAQLHIAGILFAEAGPREYLIVDIDHPGRHTAHIQRYYVNAKPTAGKRCWELHDVPGDISAKRYQSCVGRVKNNSVDGVYTSGVVINSPSKTQLCYLPIENIYDASTPSTARWLLLPRGDASTSSMPIATIRNGSQAHNLATTDLYATGNSTLYRWDAGKQKNKSRAQRLMTDPLFSGTHTLLAMAQDGIATIWGLNSSKQLYTLSCEVGNVAQPEKWSAPVPVLLGIEHLSAYVNVVDGGNTIFAHSGNGRIIKLTKETAGAKMWRPQNIILPSRKPAMPIQSFTTTLTVVSNTGQPVAGSRLSITTKSRTPVYIDGQYHVLGSKASIVTADNFGTITVVEATDNLNAATLQVLVEGTSHSTEVKPIDTIYQKLNLLDSEEKIRHAMVPTTTIAGGVLDSTQSRNLVPKSVSDDRVKGVAQMVCKLKSMYEKGGTLPATEQYSRVVPATFFSAPLITNDVDYSLGFFGDLFSDLGNLLRALGEAISHGVHVAFDWVYDHVVEGFRMVVKAFDRIYHAVVRTIEEIIGAVQWVFDKIEVAANEVVRFCQVLFQWDDIKRTKDVFHKVTKLWTQHQVEEISNVREQVDKTFVAAQKVISEWAGSPYSGQGLGSVGLATVKRSSKVPTQTPASSMLMNHLKNHLSEISASNAPHQSALYWDFDNSFVGGHTSEHGDDAITDALRGLENIAKDLAKKSIEDVIKEFIGFVAKAALSAVRGVVDALLGIIYELANSATALLDTSIHIPVISDILNELGVPDITFLDLLTWVAGVIYTVTYKIANGNKPPFTKDTAEAITSKSTWGAFTNMTVSTFTLSSSSDSTATALYHSLHSLSGITGFIASWAHGMEAAEGLESKMITRVSTFFLFVTGALKAAADDETPRYPIEHDTIRKLDKYLNKWAPPFVELIFGMLGDPDVAKLSKKLPSKFASLDSRQVKAMAQVFLAIVRLGIAGYHFYELSTKPADNARTAAIIGEVSTITDCLSKITYLVAITAKDPELKGASVGLVIAIDFWTAGLQIAEAAIPYP